MSDRTVEDSDIVLLLNDPNNKTHPIATPDNRILLVSIQNSDYKNEMTIYDVMHAANS